MTILFDDMARDKKIAHIEKCCANALEEVQAEGIMLADILDVWDYWLPWLLKEVKK